MAHVSIRQDVGAPAGAVWDLIGHFDNAVLWPAVTKCEIEGSGDGCVRTLLLVGDERLCERFVEVDEPGRRYRSEVLELGRLPLREFRYTVVVSESGPDHSRIEWNADFEAEGVQVDYAEELVRGFYDNLGVSIRDRLGV